MEFDFKNYKKCYFNVSFYKENNKAMYITIFGKEEDSDSYPIDNCSIFNSKVRYSSNIIAIKEEYVSLFESLRIIKKVLSNNIIPLNKCHNVLDYADKPFSICEIDVKMLRRFSKEWNYQYE